MLFTGRTLSTLEYYVFSLTTWQVYYSKTYLLYISDCWEAHHAGNRKQGIYSLHPAESMLPFLAYCDGAGWTIIQRRFDGNVDFYRFVFQPVLKGHTLDI